MLLLLLAVLMLCLGLGNGAVFQMVPQRFAREIGLVTGVVGAVGGIGGFILPNDRVDVILSKREKTNDKSGPDTVNSEVILSNVRVLAIDQAPREKDGQNAVIGKTVTLELKPEQAETLARSRQSGTLALALRSIADANAAEMTPDDQAAPRSGGVNVIKYGVQARQLTSQK